VQQLDGSTATVVSLRVMAGTAFMYDLTVSNVHTFAVGNGQFVVHNCNPFAKTADDAAHSIAKKGLPWFARRTATVAVGYFKDATTGEVRGFVSLNSYWLRNNYVSSRIARQASDWGLTFVDNQASLFSHAEVNLLTSAETNGMQLLGMDSSNLMCSYCTAAVVTVEESVP
jgi:hypothetical protein